MGPVSSMPMRQETPAGRNPSGYVVSIGGMPDAVDVHLAPAEREIQVLEQDSARQTER
jgi:hypothetical protein